MENTVNLFALTLISFTVTLVIGWLWLVLADRSLLREMQKQLTKNTDNFRVVLGVTVLLFTIVNSLLIDESIIEQSLVSLWKTWLGFWIIWYILLFFKKEQAKVAKKFIISSLKGPFWYFGVLLFAIFTFSYSIYVGLFF